MSKKLSPKERGRLGGLATSQKYGKEHFSRIGKKGFQATTDKHFQGQRAYHLSWLRQSGLHAYWSSTGLSMKRDLDGRAIWPETKPIHPAHSEDGLPF